RHFAVFQIHVEKLALPELVRGYIFLQFINWRFGFRLDARLRHGLRKRVVDKGIEIFGFRNVFGRFRNRGFWDGRHLSSTRGLLGPRGQLFARRRSWRSSLAFGKNAGAKGSVQVIRRSALGRGHETRFVVVGGLWFWFDRRGHGLFGGLRVVGRRIG